MRLLNPGLSWYRDSLHFPILLNSINKSKRMVKVEFRNQFQTFNQIFPTKDLLPNNFKKNIKFKSTHKF